MDITPDVPKSLFAAASKSINCDQMALSDAEAELLSKHLSILLGGVDSRLLSLAIIIMVVAVKVILCIGAIKAKVWKR